MMRITQESADRLLQFLREIDGSIPDALRPLLERLTEQLGALQCEEGLLTELIILLQDYYTPKKKTPKTEEEEKKEETQARELNDLVILLSELNMQEQQILYKLKIRR